jgi:hypothetical protein
MGGGGGSSQMLDVRGKVTLRLRSGVDDHHAGSFEVAAAGKLKGHHVIHCDTQLIQ